MAIYDPLQGNWSITQTWNNGTTYSFNAKFEGGTIAIPSPVPNGPKFWGSYNYCSPDVAMATADFDEQGQMAETIIAYCGTVSIVIINGSIQMTMHGNMTGSKLGDPTSGQYGTFTATWSEG